MQYFLGNIRREVLIVVEGLCKESVAVSSALAMFCVGIPLNPMFSFRYWPI